MANTPTPAVIRFGPFELDMQSGELSRSGRKVRLQGQSFRILAILLDRPGEVVTREELEQKLWSGDTYVDFEHGVNNSIKRLREALGDSAEKPRFIETLPRKGYRFIGVLNDGEANSASATAGAAETGEFQRSAKRGQVFLLMPADGSGNTFEFDGTEFRLTCAGSLVALEPKALHLLLYLLENRGRLIRKQELLDRIWQEANVSESALTRAVVVLRKGLNDDSRVPRFVETVPTLGYRFIAEVKIVQSPADEVAQDAAADPSAVTASLGSSFFRRWQLLVAALLIIAVGAGAFLFVIHRRQPLTETDTIVLADFTNSTGDAVFDATLRQGLEIQLQQSPFLSLVPGQRVREVMKMMAQPADARLTPAIAREVCLRTASAAVLDGSIAALGSQYVLGLRATDCRTGKLIGDEQAQATRKEDVLATLDSMTSKLRAKLGESLTTVAQYDVPLAEATTSSLEALQAYSLGDQKIDIGDNNRALPYFQHATELDPDFAMAYEKMGCSCVSPQAENAQAYMTKAYSLRQKVSERERLMIEGDYFQYVEGDTDKAIAAHQLLVQIYPRDGRANAMLSLDYRFLGDWERALPYAQTGNRLAPETAWIYDNLGYVYMSLGRLDDVAAVLRNFDEHKLLSRDILAYLLAFLQGDTKRMQESTASSIGKPVLNFRMLYYQALTEQWHGHMGSARELIRQSVNAALNYNAREKAAAFTADTSLFEAAAGNFGQARAGAQAAMKILPNRDVRKVDAVTLALTGDITGAEKLAAQEEREELDTSARRFWLPAARAEIALQRHDPGGALAILQAADTLDRSHVSMLPVFLRGQARLMQRDGAGAVAEFRQYIDHRGVVRNSPWGALARLELARAYSMQGDTAKARTEYQEFLTFWKDADPDLAPLKQAKAEYAALR